MLKMKTTKQTLCRIIALATGVLLSAPKEAKTSDVTCTITPAEKITKMQNLKTLTISNNKFLSIPDIKKVFLNSSIKHVHF